MEARGSIRAESNAILAGLQLRFDAPSLLLQCIAIADHPSQKARLGCQEFLLHLVPMSGDVLCAHRNSSKGGDGTAMRQAVHKTAENLRSNNASLRRASESVLLALHKLDAPSFLSQLQTLHGSLRDKTIRILQQCIPGLRQSILANARVGGVSGKRDCEGKRNIASRQGQQQRRHPQRFAPTLSTAIDETPPPPTSRISLR